MRGPRRSCVRPPARNAAARTEFEPVTLPTDESAVSSARADAVEANVSGSDVPIATSVTAVSASASGAGVRAREGNVRRGGWGGRMRRRAAQAQAGERWRPERAAGATEEAADQKLRAAPQAAPAARAAPRSRARTWDADHAAEDAGEIADDGRHDADEEEGADEARPAVVHHRRRADGEKQLPWHRERVPYVVAQPWRRVGVLAPHAARFMGVSSRGKGGVGARQDVSCTMRTGAATIAGAAQGPALGDQRAMGPRQSSRRGPPALLPKSAERALAQRAHGARAHRHSRSAHTDGQQGSAGQRRVG